MPTKELYRFKQAEEKELRRNNVSIEALLEINNKKINKKNEKKLFFNYFKSIQKIYMYNVNKKKLTLFWGVLGCKRTK